VAILDADKEGFLRSERSLIQTIGRAARHLNGKAIMYADVTTSSMERAIAETDRRRQKQIGYNVAHGITPIGISKRIRDMIEGVYDSSVENDRKAAEKLASYGAMNEKDLLRELKRVEREMLESARNLEFERAAQLRDRLKDLKELAFGIPEIDDELGATGTDGKVTPIAAAHRRKP
jgi:excinuclease ABC subunit B